MIQLTRTRTAAAIPTAFSSNKREQLNKKLMLAQREIAKGNLTKHEWDSEVWGKSKAQLLKESSKKCAYCEAPMRVVAYGDVEHYRPKSVYWWLAYCYENYLASCTLCNQAFKKDFFPINGPASNGPTITSTTSDAEIEALATIINPDPLHEHLGMAYSDFLAMHSLEAALLPNPYYQDPEEIFGYKPNDDLQEVEVFVESTVPHAALIQQAVVDNYGLNRQELLDFRYEWYDFYTTQKMILEEQNVSTRLKDRATAKIKAMMQPKSPFTGMIRYFEKQV